MHENHHQMLLSNKNKEDTFIASGFSNWKNATESEKGFTQHKLSKTRGDAVSRFLKIPSEINDLIQTIRSTLKLQQDQNRKSLIKIMSSLRYLARQGIALRGHNEENSNFVQLLNLLAEDDSNLKESLLRKSKKYTSPTIQNKILKDMALTILREIVNSIKDSGYYSIMAEDSSSNSNVQQFVICVRRVDNMLEPREEFIGLHAVRIANAKNSSIILKDIILRLELNRKLLRGQCYDGCSTMMGNVSGVAQVIKQDINH